MKVRLHVAIQVPNERSREFDLEFMGPEILIGRDRESDIEIPLSAVSRKHAKILEQNGEWFILDLVSTHGTKVNAELIDSESKKALRDGDVVEIVHASITFHLLEQNGAEENHEERTAVVAQKMVRDIFAGPGQNSDMPYLLVMNGPHEGSKVPINSEMQEFLIGRAEAAELRIDDANVSRRHAQIKREWNELLIADLGSKNGVIVNGRKISSPTRLKDADEIYLGAVHLTFIDPTASMIGRVEEMVALSESSQTDVLLGEDAKSQPESFRQKEEKMDADVHDLFVAQPAFVIEKKPERASFLSGIGVAEILLVVLAITVLGGLVWGVSLLLA